MKYTNEVIINLPVRKVVQLFDNPDNMKKWMPGLLSFEPISGKPGQPGAKSRLKFKMKNRDVELIETVTARNLPEEFSGTYEWKGMFNIVKNKFISIDENTTRHVAENEFQFSGMMKLFGLVMTGAFKKRSQEYLDLFKSFAEKEGK
ncbi:MAG TPA: SRPBCC family protein [Bacteroidota bacterium]|nr:SRPBCC family protein [Bacteroidota bacterium]